MNKRELTSQVAERTGLKKTDVYKALQATIECITQTIQSGERITLMGFGSFFTQERPPRVSYNLYTKEKKQLESRKVIKFKSAFPPPENNATNPEADQ